MQRRTYADKYRATGVPVSLIGVEFSREARNVVGFEVEAALDSPKQAGSGQQGSDAGQHSECAHRVQLRPQ